MDDVRILEETVDEHPASKWLTYLIEIGILALALALVLVIRFQIYEPTVVISRSMEPTLHVDDRLIIDHRGSLHHAWQRGDIVMFAAPPAWGATGETLIKRVIGLPGETLAIVNGQVQIDSRTLNEPYLAPGAEPFAMAPLVLEQGQYFVMGDNRNNSQDSRVNGPISDHDIEGRAIYRYWPAARAGSLPTATY